MRMRAHLMEMEKLLKAELSVSTLRSLGRPAGGCISNGESYETDSGRIFVKYNGDDKARTMFEGEFASLNAIFCTKTVRAPRPIKVFKNSRKGGYIFAMEHLNIRSLNRYQAELGKQLANLHLHNGRQEPSAQVKQFGFECDTCCGFIAMNNEWMENWVEFYTQKRLQLQFDLVEKECGDRQARELWSQLIPKIPSFFAGIKVGPSLLHGDLWSGNAAEDDEGPVVYDPASFYGHHEFDLAIADMFGGFTEEFYSEYHGLIPKAPGFLNRHKLYILFHYVNHWNHFGSSYRSRTIQLLNELITAQHTT